MSEASIFFRDLKISPSPSVLMNEQVNEWMNELRRHKNVQSMCGVNLWLLF